MSQKKIAIPLLAVGLILCASLVGRLGIGEINHQSHRADPALLREIKFEDVSARAGIHFVHKPFVPPLELKNVAEWISARGAGVAVADFDNDGNMDFYVTSSRAGTPNALYRNRGDGTFVDVAGEMGVANLNGPNFVSMSALWVDTDNHGWPDLYVIGMGCNKLFKNIQGKRFIEVTGTSGQIGGIPDRSGNCGSPSSVLAFDYDHDGFLDIFVSNLYLKDRTHLVDGDTRVLQPTPTKLENGPASYLFHNNGNGTFTDVAEKMGVANHGWAVAAGAADVDNDGWPDLFVANDVNPDKLFINHGGKYFEDVTRQAFPGQLGKVGMSADMVDLDGDGLPEIYSSKISSPGYMSERNELWKNLNGRNFKNVARDWGVAACGWSWNAKFVDIAHRGLKDLVVVNGLFSGDRRRSYWFAFNSMRAMDNLLTTDAKAWPPMRGADFSGHERSCVFLNTGQGFTDVAKEVGVDDLYDGRGLALIDFRNNGKQSLLVNNSNGPVLLYENVSNLSDNDWIGFDLRSHKRTAVGARVFVRSVDALGNQLRQFLEVNAGNGYASQSDPRLVFGLGKKPAKIEEIRIRWPGKPEENVKELSANAYHRIDERE